MLLLGKVRSIGAIFSIAVLIAEAATTATNLPNSASNRVLKDVTSTDKVVPSESVAIDYDKTTSLNVPLALEEHLSSRAPPSSNNVPTTHGMRSTSRATLSSTREVHSIAKAALTSTVPPTLEVPSTPNVALSSTPKEPSTPNAAESSLVSQTSRIAPTPIGAEPISLKVQPQSKAASSSSIPPTPSTSGSLRSFTEAPSVPQVYPNSKAVPEIATTFETNSTSRDALRSSLPPTQSTETERAESKYASSPSLPSTSSNANSSSAEPTVQIQQESKAVLRPVPDVRPTAHVKSSFLPTPATEPSLSFSGLSPTTSQEKSKAALNSNLGVLTTPNLHLSLTEIQQLIANTRPSFKPTNLSVSEAAMRSTASLTPELAPRTILLSRQNANLTLEGISSISPESRTLTSSPGIPLEAPKSSVISNSASHLLRMSEHPTISTPALFEEADPARILRVQRTTPRPFARQVAAGGPCQGEGRCVPLSYCRLLADLLDRSCLIGDRLQQLTCGYGNREPFVCCPPGGFASVWQTGPPPVTHPTYPPTPSPSPRPPPPPPPSPLPQKCGIPQVFNWRADYRGLGSQPWVARVGFKSVDSGAMQYPCCGSIISARVILTAAHCALAKTVGHKLSSVRVGEFDAAQDPDCTAAFCAHKVQDIPVSHVVVHPAYERATFLNDIALLVLRQPLNFTLSTQPVCLDGGGNYSPMPYEGYVGQRAKLVGWGMTAGQTDVPDLQQQLDLPVVPLEQCTRLYDEVVPITPQHVCVGGEPGRDACSGFGGAPLVMLDSATHTKYYQIAMVSFGSKQCGAPGVPSVYTRIDKYFEWIRSNMNY